MSRAASRQPGPHTLACVVALALGVAAPAWAQEASPERQPLRPPVLVVDDLVGDDWKASRAAHDELLRAGARAVPALVRARQAAPFSADARRPLDRALAALVQAVAAEVGAPLEDAVSRVAAEAALGGIAGAIDRDRPDLSIPTLELDDLGDIGSIGAQVQRDWLGKRARARTARGALALLGPAVTGPLLAVPPVRTPEHAGVLLVVVQHIYLAERGRVLASREPAAREAFRRSYLGLVDLAAPIVAAGIRDEDPAVRAMFQELRDQAVEQALTTLGDPSPPARAAAEEALLRLEHLALPALQRVARGEDPARKDVHLVEAARRLTRWVRFGLSAELVRRLGDDLETYEQLDFRGRRARVIELERLGGAHAVPALRALLREETSDEVRAVAAIGLFRQGDPSGADWLALHGSGIPLVRLSARELSAIYMDQGLRYLQLSKYERAEQEFKKVLEVEPQNEVAWYNLACTYSRWGKVDLAIEHLRRAVEHGFDDVGHMQKDSDLDAIRNDARFKAIIAGIQEGRAQDEPPAPPDPEDDGGDE